MGAAPRRGADVTALIGTSSYCLTHCWVGPVGTACPECKKLVDEDKARWEAMPIEEKIEALRRLTMGGDKYPRKGYY